jgi:hypothetical protein
VLFTGPTRFGLGSRGLAPHARQRGDGELHDGWGRPCGAPRTTIETSEVGSTSTKALPAREARRVGTSQVSGLASPAPAAATASKTNPPKLAWLTPTPTSRRVQAARTALGLERPPPSPHHHACGAKPREPSPKRMGPVKGTCCLEPRRLLSCSDMLASPRTWSASSGSGVFRTKHGVPVRPISATSARQRACGFLRARCRRFATRPPTFVEDRLEAYSTRIRPTDFCHPTYLSNLHPRSWLSSCLSPARGLAQASATDRGTRRFTTSLPASAGSDDAVLGCSPRPFVGSSF